MYVRVKNRDSGTRVVSLSALLGGGQLAVVINRLAVARVLTPGDLQEILGGDFLGLIGQEPGAEDVEAAVCPVEKEDGTGVWVVMDKSNLSAARRLAEICVSQLRLDPNDFKLRDRLVSAISPTLEGMLDYASGQGK